MKQLAILASSGSTALINWCCKPYVVSISKKTQGSVELAESDRSKTENNSNTLGVTDDSEYTFETMTLFGNPRFSTVKAGNIKPSTRLFSSWQAAVDNNSRPRNFYVHLGLDDHTEDMQALIDKAEGVKSKLQKKVAAEQFDDMVKKLREAKAD
jgi:hypothetical protein